MLGSLMFGQGALLAHARYAADGLIGADVDAGMGVNCRPMLENVFGAVSDPM